MHNTNHGKRSESKILTQKILICFDLISVQADVSGLGIVAIDLEYFLLSLLYFTSYFTLLSIVVFVGIISRICRK